MYVQYIVRICMYVYTENMPEIKKKKQTIGIKMYIVAGTFSFSYFYLMNFLVEE